MSGTLKSNDRVYVAKPRGHDPCLNWGPKMDPWEGERMTVKWVTKCPCAKHSVFAVEENPFMWSSRWVVKAAGEILGRWCEGVDPEGEKPHKCPVCGHLNRYHVYRFRTWRCEMCVDEVINKSVEDLIVKMLEGEDDDKS